MSEVLYNSTGVLQYSKGENYSLRVLVDPEIVDYYRALMPKAHKSRKQMYAPHVSVVRKEVPPNLDVWEKYEGQEIDFKYSNIVHFGRVYYWLNVFCVRLEEIRTELGLEVSSPYTLPPEGFNKCFHMTIGNIKED